MSNTNMTFRAIVILFAFSLLISPSRAQWVKTGGPFGNQYEANCLVASGSNLFVGTWGTGVYRSTDNGLTWAVTGLTKGSVWCLGVSGTNLFAGTLGTLFRSSDSGSSWTDVSGKMSNNTVTSLLLNGSTLFACTYSIGVFRSDDNGVNWTRASTGLMNDSITTLASCGSNLIAGTYEGVFESQDNGASWTNMNSGLTRGQVLSLGIIGTNVFASIFDGGVFRTNDYGKSWTDVSTGFANGPILEHFVVKGANLFASSYGGGVFHSSDSGSSWASENIGLWGNLVDVLSSNGSYLFASINATGLFRRPFSEMLAVSDRSDIAFQSLPVTFPNPFTLRTTIPFSLPRAEHVSLIIFDILGHEIATLADQDFDAGLHEVEWNAGDAVPGVYYCRVATEEGVQTSVLVKEDTR